MNYEEHNIIIKNMKNMKNMNYKEHEEHEEHGLQRTSAKVLRP